MKYISTSMCPVFLPQQNAHYSLSLWRKCCISHAVHNKGIANLASNLHTSVNFQTKQKEASTRRSVVSTLRYTARPRHDTVRSADCPFKSREESEIEESVKEYVQRKETYGEVRHFISGGEWVSLCKKVPRLRPFVLLKRVVWKWRR
jgi:hypothetical protein